MVVLDEDVVLDEELVELDVVVACARRVRRAKTCVAVLLLHPAAAIATASVAAKTRPRRLLN